jgi:UDP-glucose 4-epimerase
MRYWDVNVSGSEQLLAAMAAHGCRTMMFSSSVTFFGYPETVPIAESAPNQVDQPLGLHQSSAGVDAR